MKSRTESSLSFSNVQTVMFRGIAGEAYENLALDRIEKNGE
jgi:hypothetical protein